MATPKSVKPAKLVKPTRPTKRTRPAKRAWPRRVAKGLGALVGVPLVVALAGVGYLHTGSGKARVRAALVERLGERVNGSVEIGELDYALFGEISLGRVTVRDLERREVVALDRLVVAPAWRELLGGDVIPLDALSVHGLRVTVVNDASGESNLKKLAKKPFEPSKKTIDLRALTVRDVRVELVQPDGTRVALSGLELTGSARFSSVTKSITAALAPVRFDASIEKPASGLDVKLAKLETGLDVAVANGLGVIKLAPLSATLGLRDATRALDRSFPIKLGGLSADVGGDGVKLTLDQLATGLLALTAVHVTSGPDGAGAKGGDLVGLELDAREVNALLGREVLLENVDLAATLAGTEAAPKLDLRASAGAAKLSVTATVHDPGAERPAFELALSATDFDSSKLLAPSVLAVPVTMRALDVTAKGTGRDAASLDARVTVNAEGATVRGVAVTELSADVLVRDGKASIERAAVAAAGQRVTAKGSVALATRAFDLELGLHGDLGDALAKLGAAGLPVSRAVPVGLLAVPEGDLVVNLRGAPGQKLRVTARAARVRALGGAGRLEVQADFARAADPGTGAEKLALGDFDAMLEVRRVRLSSLLRLRGKTLPAGFDALVDLRVRAVGTPAEPGVRVDASATTERADGGARLRADLVADMTDGTAHVSVRAANAATPADAIAIATAELPLALTGARKGFDARRPLAVKLRVGPRPFDEFAAFAPKRLVLPPGSASLAIDLAGSLERPRGEVDLDVVTTALGPGGPAQRAHLHATLASGAGSAPVTAAGSLALHLDQAAAPVVKLDATARFPSSPFTGGARGLAYDARVRVGPQDLAALPDVPELARARATGGTVELVADLAGSLADLFAKVDLRAAGLRPRGRGPFDATARVELGRERATVEARVDAVGAPLATLAGSVGLSGNGLVPRARKDGLDASLGAALDAPLDATLALPPRAIASLAALHPALAEAAGTLAGEVRATGTLRAPVARGAVRVRDVEMTDGSMGGLAVELDAGAERAAVAIALGAPALDGAPVRIDAALARAELAGLAKGEPLRVELAARAKGVDVRALVPAFALPSAWGRDALRGALEWDMKGELVVRKSSEGVTAVDPSVRGALELTGASFRLPGTKRVYERVEARVEVAPGVITLARLEAHEGDADVRDRWISATGALELDGVKPVLATLDVRASKWLLFGTKTLGLADAPRGTLDLRASARVALDRAIKQASVEIGALDVSFPDRFEKAHQPEDVHVGDVFFVDDAGSPAPGKLPVPTAVRERLEAVAALEPEPDADPDAPTGLDVAITIRPGARVLLSPIELRPHGSVVVKVRGAKRDVRGRLDMGGGELALGGGTHPLVRGSVVFDDARPKGFVDLDFERRMPPWALRNVSEASAGRAIRIHMFGPLAERKTVLSGAGSPGALWDLLSMHNVGRELRYAEPDAPASVTVDFPQREGLLVLSFLAVNLPHLLFLDRVAGWADPYDDETGRAYGRVEHYEGDRYVADGKGRVRALKRPRALGASEAEIEVDYLFVNDPRVLLGVGAAAGSRGGGGPGVVLEWSSKD